MANGLRSIIRRAQRQDMAILARRNRFAGRLNVEELEDRIAPAAGDLGGSGTAAGAVYTLTNGQTATLDLGVDVWTLTSGGGYGGGGNIVITFDAATGSATKITSIDFGNSGALDAATTLAVTNSNGAVTNTLTIDSVVDTSDNASTVSLSGNNATISNGITVGTVSLSNTGIATWNTGAVTGITTETVGTSMRVGAVGATGITATTSFVGSLTVVGSLAGPVTSALTMGAITLEAGSTAAGDITATTGNMGAVTLGNAGDNGTLTFAGDLKATVGSIASISGTDETSITLSGAVTAGTSVGTIGTQLQTISGAITAGTTVGTITVLTDLTGAITGTSVGALTVGNNLSSAVNASTTTIGAVAVTNDFSGTLTATTSIGNVTVGNDLTGDITATTTLGDVTVTNGSITTASVISAASIGTVTVDADDSGTSEAMAGTLTATTGAITAITVGEGDLSGAVTAGTTIGAIAVGGNLTSAVEAGTTLAGITIVGDLTVAGSITSGTNATGDITAADLIGAISIGGNLVGSVTATDATDGSVDALTVSGVIAPTGAETIAASGGAVVVTAGGIKTAGGTLGITATTDVTITINGTDHNGAVNGAIEADDGAITITADSANAGSIDNGGDVIITATYIIGDADAGGDDEAINIAGDDVTLTMNSRATAVDTDVNTLTAITVDGNITINAVTGDLTVTTVTSDYGALANLTVTDDLAITTLTTSDTGAAGTGTVGNITAGGTLTLGTVTANDGIGNLASLDNMALTSVTATTGNVGTVTAGDADNDGKTLTITTKIEATAGKVGAVSATGNIVNGGTIVAGAQTVTSGVILSITDNDIIYTIESTNALATDEFNLTFSPAATNTVDINEIDRDDASTGGLNLSFKTNAPDGVDADALVELNDTFFNVSDIDFAAADITGLRNKFGTLTIEGSTTGALNFGTGSVADAIILQGDLGAAVSIDNLNILSASLIGGGAATAALADTNTQNVANTADPTSTVAAGTYTIPVDPTNAVQVFGVSSGTKFSSDSMVAVGVGTAVDDEAVVTFAAGAFTGITGADGGLTFTGDIATAMDLTTVEGPVNITGDVSGALTLGDDATVVAITGDVSGTVTLGTDLTSLTITGALSGAVSAANTDITGAVVLGFDGAVTYSAITANVTIGSVGGALTLGDVATGVAVNIDSDANGFGLVVINSIGDTGQVTLGTLGAALTVNEDMGGSLIVGDGGGQNITITGNFGSLLAVNEGNIATLTLNDENADGTIGTATSVIAVAGSITTKIDAMDAGAADAIDTINLLANIYVGGVLPLITNGGGDGDTLAYAGKFAIGVYATAGDFGVDTNAGGALAGTEYAADVNGTVKGAYFGTASYNATDGQLYAFTDIILDDNGGGPTITLNGNVSGNIYVGDDMDIAITIDNVATTTANDGSVAGSIIVDDDAAVSALLNTVTQFKTLYTAATLSVDETAAVAAFEAALTAQAVTVGTLADTFDDGVAKVSTGAAFALTSGSVGGITAEGNLDFATLTVTGNLGNLVSTGTIGSGGAAIVINNGNLGLITADGAINADIAVDSAYTFTGIINTGGGYTGAFDVAGTVGKIIMNGAWGDTLGEFNTDDVAMYSAGLDFAIEGYAYDGVVNITVTGATVIATYNPGTDTVALEGLAAASTVAIDEDINNGLNDLDDITVDGALLGSVTVTGSVDDLTIAGNLTGTFNADGAMTTVTVQGNWTGTVDLDPANAFAVDPTVTTITVWGSVATATLSGADFITAVDQYGDAIAASTATANGGTVTRVGTSNQYFALVGSRTATVSYGVLFNQVSRFEVTGRGSLAIYSLDSAAAPVLTNIVREAKNAWKGVGSTLFDGEGNANLPNIDIAMDSKVTVKEVYVDGNMGNLRVAGGINKMWVSGTAGNVTALKYIKNAQFGNVGTLNTISLSNVNVENNVTVCIYSNKISNLSVLGDVDNIRMTGSKASISNSLIADNDGVFTTNFRYNNWDGTAGDPNDDIQFNPVKIKNSILPSLS